MNGQGMDKDLRSLLAGRLHEGDIRALGAEAEEDGMLLEALFALCCAPEGAAPDKRTEDNAAWVLTPLPARCNAWLQERQGALMDEAMATANATKRRLVMTLLARTKFGRDDLRTDFLDFCLSRILAADEPVAVRSLGVKLAHRQCVHFPELLGELRQTLAFLSGEALKPALRSAVKKVMG